MTQIALSNTQDSSPDGALTVFYDASCPLCRAEIGFYQRRGAQARFIDVSSGEGAPAGVSCEAALARFHIAEPDGAVRSGAAAFAALWRVTPGWRWLGRIGGTRPFVWLGEGLYRVFLLIRPSLQKLARR